MPDPHPYIVLGAGPAGLTAARALLRAGKKAVVVEKAAVVGGLSASPRWNGFIAEYGPHVYHVKRDRIDEIVRSHYPAPLPAKIINTRMLIRGRFFDYPLKFWQLLQGLNPFFSARMLLDFLFTTVQFKIFPRPDDSFRNWGIRRFGRTLYNLCFGQYTERLWGVPAARLSVRLASQKLHKLNLKDVIVKLLGGRGQEQATYWKEFYYPEEGMGVIFENMAAALRKEGGEVWLKSEPVSARVEGGRVLSVRIRREGAEVDLPCAGLLSTIPLNALTAVFKSSLPEECYREGQLMRNRALILCNTILPVSQVSSAHWVYLLDPAFRCNRYCEPKNLLASPRPPDRTMIAFEVCCDEGDGLWSSPDEAIARIARTDAAKIPVMKDLTISGFQVVRVKDAYPVYDLAYEDRLKRVIAPFAAIRNLFVTGRQGLFLNDLRSGRLLGQFFLRL
ncbi:MAG: NAD(P)-binding protein [Candidatus Aureabacteria bacterium]|nr:NAD(P)-binding protein [Candidatus Auribacterota bacterium]